MDEEWGFADSVSQRLEAETMQSAFLDDSFIEFQRNFPSERNNRGRDERDSDNFDRDDPARFSLPLDVEAYTPA